MRRRIALLAVGATALAGSLTGAGLARSRGPLPRSALVPNAVAFHDRLHGVLGTGWQSCVANSGFRCRPSGTISVTSDGGKTWHVVRRTPQPVVAVYLIGRTHYYAQFDDGETLTSHDGGRTWHPAVPPPAPSRWSACPRGWLAGIDADFSNWSVCSGQPGAGNVDKVVFHGSRRVAYTLNGKERGGISSYGYPVGIAGAFHGGFALIWESRGTLYVTRDGGRRWIAKPEIARPELDFGFWAYVLPHGVGYAILAIGGTEKRRLIETTNAGRTWRVVRRWR